MLIEYGDFLGQAVVVSLAAGAEKVARLDAVAGDVLARDQILDQGESFSGIIEKRGCLFRRHRLGQIAFPYIDATGHHAAIAGRTAEARFIGIEYDTVEPLAVKLK